jgi:hypothetical protein
MESLIFTLTESGINKFEDYISTKQLNISNEVNGQFQNSIKDVYKTLKTSPVTTCYHIGECNLYWMWYIYKSKNSKIYLIKSYMGKYIYKIYYVDDDIITRYFWQFKESS